MLVPANTPFTLTVTSVQLPYLVPSPVVDLVVSANSVRNITLSTGYVIQGLVSGDGGAPVSGASVLIRQIAGTSSTTPSWSRITDVAGRYAMNVPKTLFPNDFVVTVHADGYVRSTTALTVTDDVTHDVQLARGVTVSGVVTDTAGTPLNNVRVRASLAGSLGPVHADRRGGGVFADACAGNLRSRGRAAGWPADGVGHGGERGAERPHHAALRAAVTRRFGHPQAVLRRHAVRVRDLRAAGTSSGSADHRGVPRGGHRQLREGGGSYSHGPVGLRDPPALLLGQRGGRARRVQRVRPPPGAGAGGVPRCAGGR